MNSVSTFPWETAPHELRYVSPLCCMDVSWLYTQVHRLLRSANTAVELVPQWRLKLLALIDKCRKAVTTVIRIRLIQKHDDCFLQVKTSGSGPAVYGPLPP